MQNFRNCNRVIQYLPNSEILAGVSWNYTDVPTADELAVGCGVPGAARVGNAVQLVYQREHKIAHAVFDESIEVGMLRRVTIAATPSIDPSLLMLPHELFVGAMGAQLSAAGLSQATMNLVKFLN